MEIFVGVKKPLKILGFIHFDHSHKRMIAIILNIFSISVMMLAFLSFVWFFCFETDNIFEKTESVSLFSACFLILTSYCIFLWQRQRILELITEFELNIQDRKQLRKQINKKICFYELSVLIFVSM